jgi:glycosyltransferase involved in cell wall biosynthesis
MSTIGKKGTLADLTVGIDASRANAAVRTGVERYSHRVIQQLKRLVPSGQRVILYSDAPLRGDLAELPPGWESRVLSWPFRYFWSELRLGCEMLVRPPDVLFQPARALPFVLPRRSVVTLHDVGFMVWPRFYSLLNRCYQNLTTRLYLRRARVISVSRFTADEVGRFFGPVRFGITVVPLGVEASRYSAAAEDAEGRTRVLGGHGLRPGYLLYVGRLEDKKNIHGLLAAYEILFAILKDRAPELVLAGLRGQGADEALFRISAEARSRVRLLGHVNDDDLPYLYAGALALFFPSFYEGFGLPILESFAARTPVVCSRTASLPEVAGDAAEYFDPNDSRQMAEALLRVFEDKGLRRELVGRGLRRLANFSWERTAELVWEEIVGKKK